jgi:hypothetical protein
MSKQPTYEDLMFVVSVLEKNKQEIKDLRNLIYKLIFDKKGNEINNRITKFMN